MDYRGRYILGDTVPLTCLCVTSAGVPTEPDKAPSVAVWSGSALVLTARMPVCERFAQTGYFLYPLRLDALFGAGAYRYAATYTISGTAGGVAGSFEVVAGGHPDGAGLSMYYYARPTSSYIVLHVAAGRLIRRRNPRLP